MTDTIAPPPLVQRRSSSQASTSSRRSQRSKAVRAKPIKRLSTCSSSNAPTDLTSFPSLTPDSPPEGFRGEPAINHALSQALLVEGSGGRPASNDGDPDKGSGERGRQATLAGLTTSLPETSGRSALFSDAMLTREVPGSLHLASDEHIERMIARTGAVKLVRQFARDLALRDAEISALRLRADARERELKKMLREVQVSNQDIERRLYLLENPPVESADGAAGSSSGGSGKSRRVQTTIDDLVTQAMEENVGSMLSGDEGTTRGGLQATFQPHRNDGEDGGREIAKKKPLGSVRGWQDYFWGSSTTSRKTSGGSSLLSETGEYTDDDAKSHATAGHRQTFLDDQVLQPPGAAGPGKQGGDDASVHSHRSSRSIASWSVRLFAGNSQAGKDKLVERPRSTTPDARHRSASPAVPRTTNGSALAALKRLNGGTGVQPLSRKSSPASSIKGSAKPNLPTQRRTTASGSTQSATTTTNNTTTDATRAHRSSSASHGPVEMDAILPMESKPPTLTHIYADYTPGALLTDRFGFIYDQRRNRRQREAIVRDLSRSRRSSVGGAEEREQNPTDDASRNGGSAGEGDNRSPGGRWQDYLKIATKPTELLLHTPAAAPIVSVESAGEIKPRATSVSIDKNGSLSVTNSTSQPSASTSNVVSNHAEFVGTAADQATAETSNQDQEAVRLLLQRLTEIHDVSQRERTIKWNEFMRKVRAERQREGEAAASLAPERATNSLAMPEVLLADGEVVGIAGLGNKGKVGRAKWREFKSLVLGGIPVAYRAKIWSECSGASALRIPGYYDELVKGTTTGDSDPAIVSQIEMDIHRTLTDNIFFRKGPGVSKLREVLLAYSRRNPEVGYCQGMNLIAGSLLLIMPTAEDAFWVLASIIENILPPHYYDHGLLASRADQQVLRQYVAEILPRLSAHLDELGIELEALTFQWFLSVFTDCLSAEALYRVWDVVLCLSAPHIAATAARSAPTTQKPSANDYKPFSSALSLAGLASNPPSTSSPSPDAPTPQEADHGGGGSTFFFQVALALLKLNEQQLLMTCSTPAAVYTYINHQMTNHAISIDGLIQASEALRNVVRWEDVLARRAAALKELKASYATSSGAGRSAEAES
ncbi:hypothetical protein VTO42DRAFT_8543 [Malbranchea cinnamomea]